MTSHISHMTSKLLPQPIVERKEMVTIIPVEYNIQIILKIIVLPLLDEDILIIVVSILIGIPDNRETKVYMAWVTSITSYLCGHMYTMVSFL